MTDTRALVDALRRIDVATVGAQASASRDIHDWIEDIEGIQRIARAALAAAEQPAPAAEPVAPESKRDFERREMQAWRDWAWNKEGDPIGCMSGQAASLETWLARARLAAHPPAAQAQPAAVPVAQGEQQ